MGKRNTNATTVAKPIATEQNKDKEEKINKNIDFESRGFASIADAKAFVDTKYFKGLGKEDKEEYLNWLKS